MARVRQEALRRHDRASCFVGIVFFLEFTTATEGRRLGEVAEYADADVHFRSTVKYTGSAAGRSAHCLCTLPTARTHRTAIVLR